MDRRSFLQISGGYLSVPVLAAVRAPDQILLNGNIYQTPDERCQALAVSDGVITASGTNDEIRTLVSASTRRTDLAGSTVLPGFIDSHTHVASSGLAHLRQVDCDLRSIAEIQKAIRSRAQQTPKGAWVMGFKYDDTKTAEGRKISKSDLDTAAPDHPVVIRHRGGHTAFANSLALQKADIQEKTPNP